MTLPADMPFIVEEKHDLPLVRLSVTLARGGADDPPDAAGLACFASELTRRAAGGRGRQTLDTDMDQLGADLNIAAGHDAVSFSMEFLTRHLEQAMALLATIILRADFPSDEARQLRRESLANLDELEEDDPQLARRFFQRQLFAPHPYGQTLLGTRRTIPRLTDALARRWIERNLQASNVIFGAAGAITPARFRELCGRYFGALRPTGTSPPALPDIPRGARPNILLVDKPGRTQAQILVGQPALRWAEPDFLPLAIAVNAFGGSFTARLMNEIRSQRGLSYGASAQMGQGRGPRALQAYVFPASERTGETLGLVLKLWRTWVEDGLSPDEVQFAKKHLAGALALTLVTPEERLDYRMAMAIAGLPPDHLDNITKRIQDVTPQEVHAAMQRHLLSTPPAVTVLATARDVHAQLDSLNWGEIKTVAYNSF